MAGTGRRDDQAKGKRGRIGKAEETNGGERGGRGQSGSWGRRAMMRCRSKCADYAGNIRSLAVAERLDDPIRWHGTLHWHGMAAGAGSRTHAFRWACRFRRRWMDRRARTPQRRRRCVPTPLMMPARGDLMHRPIDHSVCVALRCVDVARRCLCRHADRSSARALLAADGSAMDLSTMLCYFVRVLEREAGALLRLEPPRNHAGQLNRDANW